MNKWHKIQNYNPYISWEANRRNGVDLPDENVPVLIYDFDKPRVFVGRLSYKHGQPLKCMNEKGYYESMTYKMWQRIDGPTKADEKKAFEV